MKKRLISVFAFALAVSAGAAFVLYQLISTRVTAGAAAAANSHPTTKTVFVAAHDLEAGQMVTEKDITKQEFVNVPDGAITKKEEILNRGVINPIHRDSPFFDKTLAGAGEGAGFASIIPKGMRALAIHVNDVAGVAGFVIAGMHVDVLIAGLPPTSGVGTPAATGQQSRTLLQNITVLSAGQNYQKDAEGKPVMVTVVNLLVTPAQAEIMTLATDERIQLVLRNPADQAIAETPGAATSNLFAGNNGAARSSAPQRVPTGKVGGSGSGNAQRVGDGQVATSRQMSAARAAANAAGLQAQMPAPPPPVPSIEVLSGNTRTEIIMSGQAARNQLNGGSQRPAANPQVSGWPADGLDSNAVSVFKDTVVRPATEVAK